MQDTLSVAPALAQALAPTNPVERRRIIQNTLSELADPTTKTVSDFYLSKYEVTNEEYKVFLDKTGRRPPLYWWSEGNKKEFEATRDKFNNELGKEGPRVYWEQNWKTLKWAIPTGQERFPITMVSWREAQAFAGWCGMRLPTEEEWMYAATGGKRTEYLGGDKPPKIDSRLKAVGSGAQGPFGHFDLTGNVWEWIDNDGYFPVAGRDAFELIELQKQ